MEAKTNPSGPSPRRLGRTWLVCLLALCAFPALAQGATREHRLRWIAPSDPDLAGYQLYLALEPGASSGGLNIGPHAADASGVAEYTIQGLDDSLDYYVRLRAYDEAGNLSQFSNEIKIAQIPVLPDPEPQANPSLTGFVLWNHQPPNAENCFQPTSDQYAVALFDPFTGGTTLDLSQHGCECFGIEVGGNADVASVRMQHFVDGSLVQDLMETAAPFAYHYAPGQRLCTPNLQTPGHHTFTVTPCSAGTDQVGGCAAAGGVEGPAATLAFDVSAPEPDPVPQVEPPATGCEGTYDAPLGARLSWTDDAASSMTVVWDAAFDPNGAQLRYRQTGTAAWTEVEGALVSFLDCDARYRADLTGLNEDRNYDYQVNTLTAGGPVWSTTRRFRTVSPRAGSFGFSFFGSAGLPGTPDSGAALKVMETLPAKRVSLVLGGGGYAYAQDAIDAGAALDVHDGIDQWLQQASRFARHVPFMPTYGDTDVNSPEQRELYTMAHPTFESAGGTHHSYSFDVGKVHFVALAAPTLETLDPATAEGEAHLAWLDADLEAARLAGSYWLVVYMHADLFSSEAGVASNPAVQAALGELFSLHGVALVLSGDGHSVERSHPLAFDGDGLQVLPGGGIHSAREGTVFVRAGVGGRTDFASWETPEAPAWSAQRDNTQNAIVRATMMGASMLVRIVGVDPDTGERNDIDRFWIRW